MSYLGSEGHDYPASLRSLIRICTFHQYILLYPTVFTDFLSGLQIPWKRYAVAQSDLGLYCPHIAYDPWSHLITLYQSRGSVFPTRLLVRQAMIQISLRKCAG